MEALVRRPSRSLPKAAERRGVLDVRRKETMLAVMIRNPRVHAEAAAVLGERQAAAFGPGPALVWTACCRLYERHNAPPPKGMLFDEVHTLVAVDPERVSDTERDDISQFLDFVYDDAEHGACLEDSESFANDAIEALRLHLQEQAALQIRQEVFQDGTLPVDLPACLEAVRVGALAEAESLHIADPSLVFPEGWDVNERIPVIPTGITVFDEFLGGGAEAGEVYTLIGPFGSMKTTAAVQGTSTGAQIGQELFETDRSRDGKKPVAIYVSTETPINQFRERVLSCTAKIPRKTLARMQSLTDLDDSPTPGATEKTAYERRTFRDACEVGDGFHSERLRAAMAIRLINEYAVFIDMTGLERSKYGSLGRNGILDVRRAITAEIRRRRDEIYPLIIWIDHASAMVSRMIQLQGLRREDETHLLNQAARECRDELSTPWKTSTFLLHQLSGASNRLGPTADLGTSDAKACTSIGEFADFCFVVGKPTADNRQLCVLRCDKARREGPRTRAVIQVVGGMAQIRNVSRHYVVDSDRRLIVSTRDLNRLRVAGNEEETRRGGASRYQPMSSF